MISLRWVHSALLRRMAIGAACLLLAVLLTQRLHDTWIVRVLENANQGSMFSLLSSDFLSDIKVVEIDQDSFKTLFGKRTPLDPERLAAIIRLIDDGGARAIAVDIDTCDWTAQQRAQVAGVYAPIIWASIGTIQDQQVMVDPACMLLNGQHWQGPPTLISRNGELLEYKRYQMLGDHSSVPTFTTVLLEATDPHWAEHLSTGPTAHSAKPAAESYEALPLPLYVSSGSSKIESLSSLLQSRIGSNRASLQQAFGGKIVLLGGAYREAHDSYRTARGEMYGVEVLANIVDAEMQQHTIRRASEREFFAVDILFGLMLIYATYRIRRFGVWAEALAIFICTPLLSGILCFILFRYDNVYLSMMPVIFGVLMHKLVDHFYEHWRMVIQLRHHM
jgi:CHASE2 domain-containing sensor protein